MAQKPPAQKPKWGMGSFLQQAVAGVESRLDLILADPEDLPSSKPVTAEKSLGESGARQLEVLQAVSRSSSNARKNDRLQERLARAMVKSNASGTLAGQSSSSRMSSPIISPAPSSDARSSMDIEPALDAAAVDVEDRMQNRASLDEAPRASFDSKHSKDVSEMAEGDSSNKDALDGTAVAKDTENPQSLELDSEKAIEVEEAQIMVDDTPQVTNDSGATIALAEHQAAELRWQEEMHGYIERIDALQSKLKYLAKEAAESANQAAASAAPGSVEKRLLEKDQRIALLLEEGQKLSKSELDHRTALKKLRHQLSENNKAQAETRKHSDRLERDLAIAEAKTKRTEASEKRASDALNSQNKALRELDLVTAERDTLSQTVQEMKAQLARAVSRAEAAEVKAQSDALEQERRRVAQLEENLTSANIEREISEEKMRREIEDLKKSVEQEKEKARMQEMELKSEQAVLESKMESLRSRAEEASSGVAGDTQAKLLRQIETLQTQYAVASENWQTLESSLMSRLSNVERERDEVARREGDLRRKLRETNLKAKRVGEDLESARERQQELESRIELHQQEIQKLEQRLQRAADDLVGAQKDLVEQKKACDASWAQRLDDERAKWREQMASHSLHQVRTESPVSYTRRPSYLDTTSLSDYRSASHRSSSVAPPATLTSPDVMTPPRQNSYPTLSLVSPSMSHPLSNPTIMEPPQPPNFEPDEFFSGPATPATHSVFGATTQTVHSRGGHSGGAGGSSNVGINDIISESTVGAGPSVQLVERMSATVRRLESERTALKDELARVTAQRDEARQQVVDFMREVEAKTASDAHVADLEARLQELDQRYQTTLEMLGEKSEQVEELHADIADLKKIYRELVDSTMK
ncbi:hypothetical protein ASPZODRAFT_58417 [Penicilliopsis zonata CBS 506.65]|uniref:TATA element modulatory factor 1 TATA binding domain-containing protein n=1 Tax=Penicilliopsis zonata CBS 506.65 TaxID=1073090 RepID=A0A1L9SR44_9EURO|nr:hypothetical protein ASPZODRAFT_58417 [Penicilliopsis zonata CBS 506.65]OJJ49702.1 hypothetical protein ASPZODRAFT_58417 [Penicilliopsis zonata CBS 506.65]